MVMQCLCFFPTNVFKWIDPRNGRVGEEWSCVVIITTAQLHSTKPELRFCAGSKPCLWRVGDSWWWGSLTMVPARNKAKRFSSATIPQKQFFIIIITIIIIIIINNSQNNLSLEIDLEYAKELQELDNDYPSAPDKMEIKKEMLSDIN